MPAFFTYDTVRTKQGGIIGTIERTNLSNASNAAELSDYPIVCWVDVPEPILLQFLSSDGIPPRGYVFVIAAEDSQGAFLAAEDDLELVSRCFDIGDSVKRHDGLLGTVIDVSDSYDIRQLFYTQGSALKHISELPAEVPQYTIADVPVRELKAAEETMEDDFVSLQNWVGVIKDTANIVVIKLEDNSVVAIQNVSELFMPILKGDKRLLVCSADLVGHPRLPRTTQMGRFSAVVHVPHPKIGSLVVANRTAFLYGRWLSVGFSRKYPNVHIEGHVIAVVPSRVFVDWIACNPFAHLLSQEIKRPKWDIAVYQNAHTFERGDKLKIVPQLKLLDLSLPPTESASPTESVNHFPNPSGISGLHPALGVGECVRFRDPKSAAVKYRRDGATIFEWIDPLLTNGWDMNVFTITSRKQVVKVRWYDGSESTLNSNELSKFDSFEDDLRPCDIVVGRTSLKMLIPSKQRQGDSSSSPGFTSLDFNEMKFFETSCDLMPRRVGVIQSVNAHDRVATVRWYKKPELVLTESGRSLKANSHFGPIDEKIEECSMYEIMKFPALSRDYRDLVIVPPQFFLPLTQKVIQSNEARSVWRNVIQQMVNEGKVRDAPKILFNVLRSVQSLDILEHIPPYDSTNVDWVGEVIALGLDGSITVRLSGATQCLDVTIDFDLVIDRLSLDDILNSDDEDMDDSDAYDSDIDIDTDTDSVVIEKSIEYEGGDRLDSDIDDENWESLDEDLVDGDDDDDDDEEEEEEEEEDGNKDGVLDNDDDEGHQQVSVQPAHKPELHESENSSGKTSFYNLLQYLPSDRPPSFAILDIPPPADQYQPNIVTGRPPSSTSTFLKRMREEHRILSTSLPPTIYIRTYESNLRLLRCLIIGPADTPYENAPFLIDLALPPNYPEQPPKAHFHSWTSGLGRINPNLYEDGKICLSLLGTWPGSESTQSWSSSATLLQLVVSIQGLIMVKNPFFNEAGLEEYADQTNSGYETESHQYNEKSYVMSRRFVVYALCHPPAGVEDVVAWLYFQPGTEIEVPRGLLLLRDVLGRGCTIIRESQKRRAKTNTGSDGETDLDSELDLLLDGAGQISPTEGFLKPLSKGAIVMLRRVLDGLIDSLRETRKIIRGENEGPHQDYNAEDNATTTTTTTTTTTSSPAHYNHNNTEIEAMKEQKLLIEHAFDLILDRYTSSSDEDRARYYQ